MVNLAATMVAVALVTAQGAALPQDRYVANPGPVQYVEWAFNPARVYDAASFREELRFQDGASSWPDDATELARFAWIRRDAGRTTLMIDSHEAGGYQIVIDQDNDGDLRADLPSLIRFDGGDSMVEIPAGAGGAPVGLRFVLDSMGAATELRQHLFHRREGFVQLADGVTRRFVITGVLGRFGQKSDAIIVDVNHDGQLDDRNPAADERFALDGSPVVVGDAGYRVEVAESGDSVVFERIAGAASQRNSLAPGSKAPAFRVTDVEGRRIGLEQYGGRVVLLSFWASWCRNCSAQMDRLVDLYDSYSPFGFEILGVNRGEPTAVVRSFAELWGMPWPQIPQPEDGELIEKFRIRRIPSYFLIDRDGTIAWSDGSSTKSLENAVAEMFESGVSY